MFRSVCNELSHRDNEKYVVEIEVESLSAYLVTLYFMLRMDGEERRPSSSTKIDGSMNKKIQKIQSGRILMETIVTGLKVGVESEGQKPGSSGKDPKLHPFNACSSHQNQPQTMRYILSHAPRRRKREPRSKQRRHVPTLLPIWTGRSLASYLAS